MKHFSRTIKAVMILISLALFVAVLSVLAVLKPVVVGILFFIVLVAMLASPIGKRLIIGIAGTVYTESNYLSDVLLGEAENDRSREVVTVLSGQNLAIGTVLGKATLGAVSETHAGNTGNGVMTLDAVTPKLANCQVGVYKAVCVIAGPDSGTFEVFDPKGNSLGEVAIGGTFASQIKFVIADGATDFVENDTFLITVAEGTNKVKILTPAALDGTQTAYGVTIAAYDASLADLDGVAIVREAVLKTNGLVWPGGITDPQKATALAELLAKQIVVRLDG